MSPVIITPETAKLISKKIKENTQSAVYNISIPFGKREVLNNFIIELWDEMVYEEYEYPDFIREDGEVSKHFNSLGLDMGKFVEINDELELNIDIFANPQYTITLDAVKAELVKGIYDDIASAWENVLREAIEEVTGKDPLSGDGVQFISAGK